MRNTLSNTLTKLAEKDDKIILLVGDIGFGVFDEFCKKFPSRFINTGVAEANMIGTAAGLALTGMKPVVYTIIPFLIMRTFEQVRNDICMQNLPVTLVGVGGGLSYGTLGPTHHAIEDISIMRSLPNMRVISPCDPTEVDWSFKNIMNSPCPTYFRLGKGGESNLLSDKDIKENKFTQPLEIYSGKDVCIISSGHLLKEAIATREILEANRIKTSIINIHQIKPENKDINKRIGKKKLLVTLEEHSIIGGLGDMVLSSISSYENSPPVIKLGIKDKFIKTIGDREYLLKEENLTPDAISEFIIKKLKTLKD